MRPLEDILIVDLSTSVSGPFAAGLLAEYGARVLKVEAPGLTDSARTTGTARNGFSAMYATINRGKESVVLDLKTDEGKKSLWSMLEKADVLLQNFRPGALAKLGFDWDTVHARCPRLLYASISGLGFEGPMANIRVYDPMIQAASGIADSQVNPKTGAPMLYQGILCDKITSMYMSQAILGGLLARERGLAEGQKIELSMLDCAVHFHWCEGMYNFTFLEEDGLKKAPEFSKFYRLSRNEENYFSMPMMSDSELSAGLKALSLEHLHDDDRFNTVAGRLKNSKELGQIVAARITEMGFDTAMEALVMNDAPACPVVKRKDLASHPQIQANGTIVEVLHPIAGRMHAATPPVKMSQTPLRLREPAPGKGQQTDAIAKEFGFEPLKRSA